MMRRAEAGNPEEDHCQCVKDDDEHPQTSFGLWWEIHFVDFRIPKSYSRSRSMSSAYHE